MVAHFFGHLASVTDADLQTRITSHLETRGYPSFRDLTVAARQGVITLDVRLPSYYVKQVAIETCRHIAGVMQVIDAIQVGPSCFNAARLLTQANELPAHRAPESSLAKEVTHEVALAGALTPHLTKALMGYPQSMHDLHKTNAPQNRRQQGLSESRFARRRRRELPKVY